MKKCSSCFQEKQLIEFNNSTQNGNQSMCRPCQSAYYKAWRAHRIAEPASQVSTSKTCFDCGLEKPIGQFGKRSTNKDKKNDYCKECWVIRVKKSQNKARLKKLEMQHAKAI